MTATRLWRAVEVLRAVDDTLREEQKKLDGRDRSVAVHGNRMIAHAVFRALPEKALDDHDADFVALKRRFPTWHDSHSPRCARSWTATTPATTSHRCSRMPRGART